MLEDVCVVINIRDKELLAAFGNHLKAVRRKKQLSQEQLAFKADISISQVSRLERGLLNPTLCTLFAIANAMEVQIEDLVNFEA